MTEQYHSEYMRRAILLAERSATEGGGPFGAVVVKDGQIIGEGSNKVTISSDPTAHAEIVAIRNACNNLNSHQLEGCTIYTSCEPCPMCLGAIYWSRAKAVYFGSTKKDAAAVGFDDDFIYQEIEKGSDERSIPFHQILPNEAASAFDIWKKKTDRIDY